MKQIQFFANGFGDIVHDVFKSTPRHGEEGAWDNQADMEEYVTAYPPERLDIGGYKTPGTFNRMDKSIREAEGYERPDGFVSMVTPGGVEICRATEPEQDAAGHWRYLWTVGFHRDSREAADRLIQAVHYRRGKMVSVDSFPPTDCMPEWHAVYEGRGTEPLHREHVSARSSIALAATRTGYVDSVTAIWLEPCDCDQRGGAA